MSLNFENLPRGLPNTPSSSDTAPRALWVDPAALAGSEKWQYKTEKIFLGRTVGQQIGLADNRHLLTIAGSRGGKGRSAIIPNLLRYTGSVLVIDPKGENARETAERRGLGRDIAEGGLHQDVFVIDPFGVSNVDESYKASFNPLDHLNPHSQDFIDECDSIADALVIEESRGQNTHFYDAARLVLRGFIAWVTAHPEIENRTLVEVKRLLNLPKNFGDAGAGGTYSSDPNSPTLDLVELLGLMLNHPHLAHGIPFEAASMLSSLGSREFGSVMSTIRNQIAFISSPPMAETLSQTDRSPDLKKWKFGGQSVYLCLPSGRMHRHARLFRLFINRLLNAIESDDATGNTPALMILDEMHVLGHMKSLETAAALVAGYGVRIWSFFQDMSQLEDIYGKRWETFLGNASVFQTFALNDMRSLKYVSERLGQSSMLKISQSEQSTTQAATGFTGQSKSIEATPLLTPDEVAAYFSRQSGNQLIIFPGVSGIMIKRTKYDQDPFFRSCLTAAQIQKIDKDTRNEQ